MTFFFLQEEDGIQVSGVTGVRRGSLRICASRAPGAPPRAAPRSPGSNPAPALTSDGQLPLDEQLARFEQTLRRNRTLTEVLARAATLDLPGWYLVAGCLYQTVWNVVSGQPPEAGILDYDLAYFDASDLSWAAED